MIIIIRALPQWGKDDEDYETPDLIKKRERPMKPKQKKGAKEAHQKRENKKNERKKEKG